MPESILRNDAPLPLAAFFDLAHLLHDAPLPLNIMAATRLALTRRTFYDKRLELEAMMREEGSSDNYPLHKKKWRALFHAYFPHLRVTDGDQFNSVFYACISDFKVILSRGIRNLQHIDNIVIKQDAELVLAAMNYNPEASKYADPSLFMRRDFVLSAVRQFGCALKYADPSLQNDLHIVAAAVFQDGDALRYAGPLLRKERGLAFAAVSNSYFAFDNLDASLKEDPLFMEAAGLDHSYLERSILFLLLSLCAVLVGALSIALILPNIPIFTGGALVAGGGLGCLFFSHKIIKHQQALCELQEEASALLAG